MFLGLSNSEGLGQEDRAVFPYAEEGGKKSLGRLYAECGSHDPEVMTRAKTKSQSLTD